MTTPQQTEAQTQDVDQGHLERYDSKAKAADLTRIDSLGAAQFIDNDHHEKSRDAAAANETAFVGIGKLQTIKKFWRASMFCYFCAFGVMMDGSVDSVTSAMAMLTLLGIRCLSRGAYLPIEVS
jgi:hypothetical protein